MAEIIGFLRLETFIWLGNMQRIQLTITDVTGFTFYVDTI
jgi:hypothetical protein